MEKRYVYGINNINEILDNGKRKIFKIIVAKNYSPRISEIIKKARELGIYLEIKDIKELDNFSNHSNHQGIIAEVSDIKKYTLEEAIKIEKDIKKTRWIAIDSLTDPVNLGNIIRSAVCLGFSAILIPENRSVKITPSVEKIASGSLEKINVVYMGNLNQTILYLKKNNFWVYGADINGENIKKVDFVFPLLLVVGSEGEGIHKKTLEHCDKIISIPQIKDFDSFNVATASAILMYEISGRILE